MKRNLILVLFLLGFSGCSEPEPVMLEFRIAEDEPAPGLTELALPPQGESCYVHDEVLLNQTDVDSAFVTVQEGRPAVELVLTSAGAERFGQLTERNVGKRCVMFLNGEPVSAPRIRSGIHVGRAVVAGDFNEAEARRVARGLTPSG